TGAYRRKSRDKQPDEKVGQTGSLLELEINVLAGRLVEPEIYRDAADRAEGREIDGQEKLSQPPRAGNFRRGHPGSRSMGQAARPEGLLFLGWRDVRAAIYQPLILMQAMAPPRVYRPCYQSGAEVHRFRRASREIACAS